MENNMSMKDAVIAYWTKAFVFKGRARRREYWLNFLAMILLTMLFLILAGVLDGIVGGRWDVMEGYIFFINKILPYITVIPSMAQASRRLHDINMDGRIAVVIFVVTTIFDFITTHLHGIFPINLHSGFSVALIGLLSVLPGIFLFITSLIRGTDGDNKYGKDPKRL